MLRAQNRLATGETVENVLEENQDTAPIEEWESKFFDECDADADDGAAVLRPELRKVARAAPEP